MKLILSAAYWVADDSIILAVWEHTAKSNPLTNSIVALNPLTKQSKVVYAGKDFSPREAEFTQSPNLRFLLFTDRIKEELLWPGLQLLDLQSLEVRTLVPPEEDMDIKNLCWSADGKRLAYIQSARSRPPEPSAAESEQVKDKFTELTGKEALSPSDVKEMQALIDTLDTGRYDLEMSVCIHSIIDGQTSTLGDFQKEMYVYGLAFLDETHLVVEGEFDEDGEEHPALLIVDITSSKSSILKRGPFLGDIAPIRGGAKVICLMEEP